MSTLRKKYYIEVQGCLYLALNLDSNSSFWYLSENELCAYLFRFRVNAENLIKDLKLKNAKIKEIMS